MCMLFGSICRANNRKEGKLNFPLFHCDSFSLPVVLHRLRVGTALHQLSTTSKSANGKWKQFSGYLIAPTPNSHLVMQVVCCCFGGISIICVQFAHRHTTDSKLKIEYTPTGGEEKWENICTVTYIFGERREFSKSFFSLLSNAIDGDVRTWMGRERKLNFNFVHCTHRYFPFWDHNRIPSRPDRTSRCSRTCWPSRSTPNRWRCQHCSSKRQISRHS